jgi:phosphoadenosine phosphosulfate reductase
MKRQHIVTDSQVLEPQQVLEMAFSRHKEIAISFSGAEDVILIDMACNLSDRVQVFCLDTGRLYPETYEFLEEVRDFYDIEIDLLYPDPRSLAQLVKQKGLFSFYRDGHQECCSIRKIAPLRVYLTRLDGWITGQRRDQSPTRSFVTQIQEDEAFSSADKPLMKYNPLANWSADDVWKYIRANGVPYNKLHDRGFRSIGCQPCTRATQPDQHEREGRWWWEDAREKECGLHVIKPA